MPLHWIRSQVEHYYKEHGLSDGRICRLGLVNRDEERVITVTAEVNREPLTGMTDLAINLDGWQMTIENESIIIGATMFATFHDTAPNFDVNLVSIWKAKESTLYTDEDIQTRLKEDWNGNGHVQ